MIARNLYFATLCWLAVALPAWAAAPLLSSATVDSAGTSLTLVFDQAVQYESIPDAAGLTLNVDAATPTLAYSSGTGSTTLVFSIAVTVESTETCTLDYNSTIGNIENTLGEDWATVTGEAVTNNSTQGGTLGIIWGDIWDTGIWDKDIWVQASETAPTATSVAVSGILREGETLTGSYTYNANGGNPEGTSTFRWLANDVAISGATSMTYVLTSSENADSIKFEVTPVSTSESGSAATSIAYGPVGAALADQTVIVAWPDTSVSQKSTTRPRLTSASILGGRTEANVIRTLLLFDGTESTADFSDAAANEFTVDGYNVLMVGNSTDWAKEQVLANYETEFFGGYSGWSNLTAAWDARIDAIFDAGYRIDAVSFDLEGGILGTDYGNVIDAEGGGSVASYIRGLITAAAGDYTGFPGSLPDSVWDGYLSETPFTDAWYEYSRQVNNAIIEDVAAAIETHLMTGVKERNPGAIFYTYAAADYTNLQSNHNTPARYWTDGAIGEASCPVLYHDWDWNTGALANTVQPAHPWITPATVDGTAEDSIFHAMLDHAEDIGCPQIQLWSSDATFVSRQDAISYLDSPIAVFDLQETSGSTHTEGITGGSNDASHAGNYTIDIQSVKGPGGILAVAKEFDGVNNRVIPGNQPTTVYVPTTGSMECWLLAHDTSSERLALATDNSSRRYIGVQSGNLQARCGAAAYFGATAISTNQWYHVVLTWEDTGGTCEFYINGSSVGTTTTSLAAGANVAIGQYGTGGFYWDGLIAGVRFYNTELNSTQVANHYAQCAPVFFDSPAVGGLPTPGNRLYATFRSNDLNAAPQWRKNGANLVGETKHFLDWTQYGFGQYSFQETLTNDFDSTAETSSAVDTYLIPPDTLRGQLQNLNSGL